MATAARNNVRSESVKGYLCAYNLFMIVLNVLTFADLYIGFTNGNFNYINHYHLFIFGTALQFIDVANAFFGATSSNYKIAALQVCGRLTVLQIARYANLVWHRDTTAFLLFAYVSIELIRYPFYAMAAFDKEISYITWLRYNAWIILYPVGICMEWVALYYSALHYWQTGVFSLPLGSGYNLNFGVVISIILVTVLPWAAVSLIRHMYFQRQKKYAKPAQKRKNN